MNKFEVTDFVVPHVYQAEGLDPVFPYSPKMAPYVGYPGIIEDVEEDTDDEFTYYRVFGYLWPEHALTPYIPERRLPYTRQPSTSKYDLAKFTKAAMQGLCGNSDGVITEDSRRSFHPNDIGSIAVMIAKSTIKALQEAEKEGSHD